jgi:ankyrin repeat protein
MDDSVSVEQARENIAAFNTAAHSGAPETALSFSASAAGARAGAGDSEVWPSGDKSVRSGHNLAPLEIEMIARIQKLYQYYIPAPPKFGDAIIYGLPGDAAACRKFSDCGESALRGLLSAAFYNNKTRKIIVPDDHRYSDELRHFFKTYSSLDQQGDQEVRDVWGALCSGRPGIVYTEINFCGMSAHFENIISLLGLLVPGALPSDCACSADVASFTDAVEAPASDDEYLSDESFDDTPKKSIHTKDCAIKILQNLCNMSENDLEVSELTFAEDGNVSWNITSAKSGEKPCRLYFNAHPDHVESELRVEIETPMGVQIQDPILGGSDVISTIPQNPDLVEPLVFAASRMAQERNLVDGYIFMHLVLHEEQNELISSNIIKWRLISSDQQGSLKREKRDYFYAALVRGYYNLVNHLLDRGAEINGLNQYGSRPLIVAARNRRLKIAQLLLDRGADINLKDLLEATALARSVEKGYLDILNFLLSRGADPRLVNDRNRTPLMIAAVRGDAQAIEILYKAAGLIDEVDNNGYTALMLAANNGHVEASQLLIASGANVNTKNSFGQTALMGAVEGGHVEVVKLLLENGALYNSDDVDKYPGFERLPDSLRARMLHI